MTTAKKLQEKLVHANTKIIDIYNILHEKKIKTCFNNGFIESMNNKVKLVKRSAYSYRYLQNLRKRILLHLGFKYDII